MYEKLVFATCGLKGIIPRMSSEPPDFVTDVRSVTFVSYYAINDILLE